MCLPARHGRPKVIETHHTYFLSREYARKKSKKVKRGDQQKIKITKYDVCIREAKNCLVFYDLTCGWPFIVILL